MKRILAAIFILCIAISFSIIGKITIDRKLDILSIETNKIIESKKTSATLHSLWEDSEIIFALILNEEKYKNLSRHIYMTSTLKGNDLINSCNEIMFEIEIIRDTQRISFENIL